MNWKVKIGELILYREFSLAQIRRKARWHITVSGRFKTKIALGSEIYNVYIKGDASERFTFDSFDLSVNTPRYEIREEHSTIEDAVSSAYVVIYEYHNGYVKLIKRANRAGLKKEGQNEQ